ncbi:hypothetical protein SKAU_G00390380 [Synaphobranchus kaupii]|uniref:Uncharacterized protein n=1 Tax=Synaphobranchus kaupii TaxID=118154 RepID=A0A9Q1EBG0_SYNKA|nr:hypothetical protein SKAU_G00390380 [Synaphobranchus kaupii]
MVPGTKSTSDPYGEHNHSSAPPGTLLVTCPQDGAPSEASVIATGENPKKAPRALAGRQRPGMGVGEPGPQGQPLRKGPRKEQL